MALFGHCPDGGSVAGMNCQKLDARSTYTRLFANAIVTVKPAV